MEKAKFRPDINGLRAWAVVSVVLFHFGIPGFEGGFFGVDIFFVISGFLMTGNIINSLQIGTFSFWDFLAARARRIIPALLFLCVFLIAAGWFLLPVGEYRALAKHTTAALLFFSNITHYRETGYFGGDNHEKWLLHTRMQWRGKPKRGRRRNGTLVNGPIIPFPMQLISLRCKGPPLILLAHLHIQDLHFFCARFRNKVKMFPPQCGDQQ